MGSIYVSNPLRSSIVNVLFLRFSELRDILEKEHHIAPTALLALGRMIEKEGKTE